MVTESGKSVPPPIDEQLDAALWRVRESVSRRISTEASARSSHRRRWMGAIGGVVLFGAGLAVGGATLPALTNPAPAFQVQCFGAVSGHPAEVTMEFDTDTRVAAARQNPVAACGTVQIDTEAMNGIYPIINGLINQGHNCGVVTTNNGQAWSYQTATDGGLSVTTGQFDPPLAANCITIQVAHVTPPVTKTLGRVACAVTDTQVNVYPGKQTDTEAICRSKGLSAYTPPTTG